MVPKNHLVPWLWIGAVPVLAGLWCWDPCRYGHLEREKEKGHPGWDRTGRSVHPREGLAKRREGWQAVQLPRQLANLTRAGGQEKHGEKQTAGQLGPSRPAHRQLTPTLPPRHHPEASDWRAMYCITTVHAPPPPHTGSGVTVQKCAHCI